MKTFEYGIPVVLDVTAASFEQAAVTAANALVAGKVVGRTSTFLAGDEPAAVESWWFPEAEAKVVDGNDNADMTLVRRDRIQGLLDAWADDDTEAVTTHLEWLAKQLTAPALTVEA